jgi:4-amino-4-deoxy-L-arabinose transferase-like glycosyltransferase
VLGGILVIAFLLRMYGLTHKPAWADEMWTLRNFFTSDYLELLRVAADDYWPPLHYLILNTLTRFTGIEMFWLRLPSVVFGVATIAAVYWVGLGFFRDRGTALLAAAFLTGATVHVLYSQEARVYSILMLLVVLSSWFFLISHRERRISPAYVATTVLLVYSHSFASWYFVAAQSVYVLVAWLLWRDGKAFWKGFLSQLIVLLLWLPLVASFVYARTVRGIVVPTEWATGNESIPWIPELIALYQALMVRSWPGAVLMTILMGLGILGLLRRLLQLRREEASPKICRGSHEDGRWGVEVLLFLVCWCSVPLLFSLFVTWFTELDTFGATRYHLSALPGLALLAAAGTVHLRTASQVPRFAVALLAVLLPAIELPRYYLEHNQPAVDEAARIVHENEFGDEPIYIGNKFRSFFYYYRGVYPRIGSEQWDSLSAAYDVDRTREEWHRLAAADDQEGLARLSATPGSNKWADTFAYERLPRRIRHEGFRGLDGYRDWMRREVARGGFQEPYWVIYHVGDRELRIPEAFELEGLTCRGQVTWEVRDLVLWHCRGEEPAVGFTGP